MPVRDDAALIGAHDHRDMGPMQRDPGTGVLHDDDTGVPGLGAGAGAAASGLVLVRELDLGV
jgi:hypothetical protein